jgi:hypothetical protein
MVIFSRFGLPGRRAAAGSLIKDAVRLALLGYRFGMSVEIKFIGADDPFRYEDGEGREYRYVVNDNGTLSIFEKEDGGHITKKEAPVAVYGPAAWFSVSGDPWSTADAPRPKVRGF